MAFGLTLQNRRRGSATPPGTPAEVRPQVPPLAVVLHVVGEAQRLVLPVRPRLVVGRGGSDGAGPDVDLTLIGGGHSGVSRQHAALHYSDQALHIEDLNSTNGTRINGMPLRPGERYRLRKDDEITLGRLDLTIRLVRVPQR